MSQNDKDFAPINIDVDERRPIGNRNEQKPDTPESGAGSNVFTSIVLVVAIAACAGSGYLYSELEQTKTNAVDTENRLILLEQLLSSTGEEMGNSTVALSVKVGVLEEKTDKNWEEIDKLWASAWRRNQEAIKKLNNGLNKANTSLDKDLKEIETTLASATTNVQQMLNRINGLNEKLSTQANDILTANVNAEQAGDNVANQSNQLKALSSKINTLESRNSTLLEKISDLESLLKEIAKKTV
ncbi:MAG: chromosome segregation ATPase [Glaciecola sp.]|jgi:chromosome segregation ATPase